MNNKKQAAKSLTAQRQNPPILYRCPTVKASGNNLPIRELLAREIVQILLYLRNRHLNQSEKAMALRIFESTRKKYFAFREEVGSCWQG